MLDLETNKLARANSERSTLDSVLWAHALARDAVSHQQGAHTDNISNHQSMSPLQWSRLGGLDADMFSVLMSTLGIVGSARHVHAVGVRVMVIAFSFSFLVVLLFAPRRRCLWPVCLWQSVLDETHGHKERRREEGAGPPGSLLMETTVSLDKRQMKIDCSSAT